MNLQTIPHQSYEKGLPQEGNYILGQKRDNNIFVYQAFNHRIADYAVKNQKFGGPDYSFNRMTWIKPNFLWMMYRSGWAEKDPNQARILAIEMTFEGFEALLSQGVLTTYNPSYEDYETWQKALNHSDVRIQWDPDHNFKGAKLNRRAVQIGLKGNTLQTFNNDYVQSIQDITRFVKEEKGKIDQGNKEFFVIDECIIEVNADLKKKFAIPEQFLSPFVEDILHEFENNGAIKSENFEKLLIENQQKERNSSTTLKITKIGNFQGIS